MAASVSERERPDRPSRAHRSISPAPRVAGYLAAMPDAAEPTFGSAQWRRACAYQPFYCEENVWRLLVDPQTAERVLELFD